MNDSKFKQFRFSVLNWFTTASYTFTQVSIFQILYILFIPGWSRCSTQVLGACDFAQRAKELTLLTYIVWAYGSEKMLFAYVDFNQIIYESQITSFFSEAVYTVWLSSIFRKGYHHDSSTSLDSMLRQCPSALHDVSK